MIAESRAAALARAGDARREAVARATAQRPRTADVSPSLLAIMEGSHHSLHEPDAY